MYEGDFFLEGLPTGDVGHPIYTSSSLELREDARYSRRLLRVKIGYALVLHHPGVIDIADSRRGDKRFLWNMTVLHFTRTERYGYGQKPLAEAQWSITGLLHKY